MGTVWASEVRDPGDAQGRERLDREHLGELVEVGAPAPPRVPRVEGRDQRVDPSDGRPTTARTTSAANTIIVGFIFTGTAEMTAILADPCTRAAFEKNIMVPRLGEPADIAAGVVYLASDESKYVTGIELTIDGGALCHQALPELDFDALRAASS